MREVTLLPSRPASGLSLTAKVIARSADRPAGVQRLGHLERADRVGDGGLGQPAMAMMSPASASSIGTALEAAEGQELGEAGLLDHACRRATAT